MSAADADPGPGRRGGHGLAVIAAGTFISLVVFTLPLADLPNLARALGARRSAQAWMLSSMSVGLAAAMLPAGALADDYGRRRVFGVGAITMLLGSVICAAAWEPVLFVAGRIVQGVGGAALIAAGLALIATIAPDPVARGRATAVWGTSLGAGIAVGPLVAGVLDPLGAWRVVYLLVGAAALGLIIAVVALARRGALAESRAEQRRAADLLGAAAFAAAMTLVLIALTEVRQPGGRLAAALIFAVAVLVVVLFVIIEQRRQHPMIRFGYFADPTFAAASLAALVVGLGVIALLSTFCSYLIADLGQRPLVAAGLLVLWSGTSALTATGSRRLSGRLGGPRQLVIGLVLVALGLALLFGADAPPRFVAGLLTTGVGTGLLNAALGREAVASAPEGRAGVGSGVNNTARYLGSAVGVTVTSLLVLGGGPGAAAHGWSRAVVVTAVVSLLGALVVAFLLRRAARPAR